MRYRTILVFAFAAVGILSSIAPATAQSVQPERFEYLVEGPPSTPWAEPLRIDASRLNARLQALGAQGWELIQIVEIDPAYIHTGAPSGTGTPGQLMIFRRSNIKEREERLLALEQRVNAQVAQLQTIRQDVLDAVRNGLAASLIGEYLEPFRAQVLGEVDRRLRERLPAQP